MKKVLFVFVIAAAFAACNSGETTPATGDTTAKDTTVVVTPPVDTTKKDTTVVVPVDTTKKDTTVKH